jgi:hypothetical protein
MAVRASMDIWLRRIPVPTTVSDPERILKLPTAGVAGRPPVGAAPGDAGLDVHNLLNRRK